MGFVASARSYPNAGALLGAPRGDTRGLVVFGPELLQAPSPSPRLRAAPALWEQVTVGAGDGDGGAEDRSLSLGFPGPVAGRLGSVSSNIFIGYFFLNPFIWGGGRAKEGGHNLGLPTLL